MLEPQYMALGGQIPPKCMPSPRAVARVASTNRPGGVGSTPFSLRRRFQRFETVPDNAELSNTMSSSPLSFTSSRSYPIVHPACDPPLCSVSYLQNLSIFILKVSYFLNFSILNALPFNCFVLCLMDALFIFWIFHAVLYS